MPAGMRRLGAPHVLITTDAIGGVWSYSLALAKGLASEGLTCTLAVLGPPPDEAQRRTVVGLTSCSLLCLDLPLDWAVRDESQFLNLIYELQSHALRVGATSVHLHAIALAATPWPMPAVAVGHSCLATWWDTVHGGSRPAEFALHVDFTCRGLRLADTIICPTQSFKAATHASYGTQRELRVVHNGLPNAGFKELGRERFVLSAGRLWDAGKNVPVLDRAAEMTDVPIRVAGPLVSPDGVHTTYSHLDHVGDLSPVALDTLMRRAAIFAASSLYEPFGLAVLEAAQRATPLLLSDIPTFRELWQDAAIFVQPEDARGWAAAMSALASDPHRRRELGLRALERSQLYTFDRMLGATIPHHVAMGACTSRAA